MPNPNDNMNRNISSEGSNNSGSSNNNNDDSNNGRGCRRHSLSPVVRMPPPNHHAAGCSSSIPTAAPLLLHPSWGMISPLLLPNNTNDTMNLGGLQAILTNVLRMLDEDDDFLFDNDNDDNYASLDDDHEGEDAATIGDSHNDDGSDHKEPRGEAAPSSTAN